ncbi:MAG: immunoglobulin domain-containing protein [Phycisphaerales bacterium]|nr:immunoglobulin domain-containing protein [Phycisphaerales bacterium]
MQVKHMVGWAAARRILAVSAFALAAQSGLAAGTWTKLAHNAPAGVNLMLLLPDGTVMAAHNDGQTIGKEWYRLTPDIHGSYVNGTWTTLASTTYTRLYFQSQVLQDGRVYVSGGEYGTGGPRAEVYNPQTNSWTIVTPGSPFWNPSSDNFYDCNSEILPDGSVMMMPVFPHSSGIGLIYHPTTNTWSNAGKLFRGTWQDEATWAKLPDDSILTIDPWGTDCERYIPASNTWINDNPVPVAMYDPFGFELGGAALLPNGKAMFYGSTGHTTIYTPTGNTTPGTWVQGPDFPNGTGQPDAPVSMMVDGKVLCAVSPKATSGNHFPTPTTFYEYDYTTNTFSSAPSPVGGSDPISAYQAMMLNLPDGTVLYSHMKTDTYVYTPSGAPLAQGKPVIASLTQSGGSFHLAGTGLNGLSEGAVYGDDWQMNSNYPIVRLNHSNGNTYYARTYNWSSTSIRTGNQQLSTDYVLPSGFPSGSYTVTVIGNGFASDAATAPTISSGPNNPSTCPGGSATFTVTATGVGPLSYQWRRGNTNINDDAHISGSHTASMTINPVGAGDVGSNYNCVVTNALGTFTSRNGTLSVCLGDFNCDGAVNTLDVLAFLNSWNAGEAKADYNGDGSINTLDVLAFLNAWTAGC